LSARTANEFSMVEPDHSRLIAPPEALLKFVRGLPECSEAGAEHRKSARIPTNLEVVCVPLNGDEEPCGDPFVAVSRNISAGGLALVHARRILTKLLSVWLHPGEAQTLHFVVKIIHCRGLGPYVEHCCQIVRRIES